LQHALQRNSELKSEPIKGTRSGDKVMRDRGFTLLEVLITLVILSVSLLALAGLMVCTTRNNSFGGHMTEGATLVQDKLEELKATFWDNIADGTRSDNSTSSTGIPFTRSWTVVTNGNMKTVTLSVTWNDRINHSIRLVSVISR
jgi:type IV pilus assembly protein PilV